MSLIYGSALAGALALAGCDNSDSSTGSGGETDGGTSYDSNGPGSSGPGPTTDTDTEEPATSTTSATTGPEVQYCPCEWINCGDVGECDGPVENPERDEPTCLCPEGALELGHACFSCDPQASSGDAHPLNIDVRTIEGRVLLDGDAPPTDEAEAGALSMRDLDSGDYIELGSTTAGDFTARVATRLYDLYYSVQSNVSGEVPDNTLARLRRIPVDFSSSPVPQEDVVAELRTTVLSGSLLVNDELTPSGLDDYGVLLLRSPESGDELELGPTSAQSYELRVLKGVYEIIYEARKPGPAMPANSRGRVGELEIGAGQPTEVTPITIPVVKLSGAVTINDAPPPGDKSDYGLLYLRDAASGALTLIGETSAQSYAINVLPGVYEIIYSSVVSGVTPHNKHARVVGPIPVGAAPAMALDINIQTTPALGAITVNNAAPPTSAADDGVLTLEGVDGLGTVVLGSTRTGLYTKSIIPGTYDVFYTQETAGAVMPQNTHARVLANVPYGALPVNVDIPVITVSGALSLSDGAEAISELEDGRVFLRDESVGDSVLLGALSQGTYSRRVIPGAYTAHYAIEAGGAVVPANGDARVSDAMTIDVDAPALDIVIPVSDAAVAVTYNKKLPPTDKVDYGAIYLESVDSGDELYLGDTTEGTVSRRVVAGSYLIRYRHRVGGDNRLSPLNKNVALDCVTFTE